MCEIRLEEKKSKNTFKVFKSLEFYMMLIGLVSLGYSIYNSERVLRTQKEQFIIQHKTDSANLLLAINQSNISSRPFAAINIQSFKLNSSVMVFQSYLINKGPVPLIIDSLTINISEYKNHTHKCYVGCLIGQKEEFPQTYCSYGLNLKQNTQIVTLRIYYKSVFDNTEYYTEDAYMFDLEKKFHTLATRSTDSIKT